MKFACLNILLAASFASALRGNRDNEDRSSSSETRRRRHLMELGTECVTYMKLVDYEDGPDEESWSCEFSPEVAEKFGGVQMLDIDGLTLDEMKDMHAVSGGTVLKVGPSSYVETVEVSAGAVLPSRTSDSIVPEPVLHVSKDDFVIEAMDEHTDHRHYKNRQMRRGRNLADTTGPLNTLVMRVIDKDGKAPPSASQLEDDVFVDNMSLKTQYERCSHNNIQIVQAQNDGFYASEEGTEYQGIIDVKVNYKAKDAKRNGLWEDAVSIAERDYNDGKDMKDSFDLVMVCYPPGVSSGWIAYAYINHHISVYNNNWCQYVSGQMHEVGHNLGLLHAGVKGASQYADQTGMMGYSYSSDDGPVMCFNAAKNYQLGWYPNQMTSVNPFQLPNGVQTYTLNGVVDYGNSKDSLVTMRIEDNKSDNDFYVGYNRATGFNSGTLMGQNKVQIFEKENGPNSPGQSYLLASLGVGDSYTWRIDKTDITVDVISIDGNNNNGKNAVITLTGDGPTVVDPTPAPTNKPTKKPTTTGPTPAPTSPPTAEPTEAATGSPTVAQEECEDDNVRLCANMQKKFVAKKKWGKLKKRCKKLFNKKKPELGMAYEKCAYTCSLVDIGTCARR